MKMLLILEFIIFIGLYIAARGRYVTLAKSAEAKGYSMSELIPVPLLILDLCNYSYKNPYDRKISKALIDIHGVKSLEVHIKLYYASKLALMLTAFFLLSLFGALSDDVDLYYLLFTLCSPISVFYLVDKDLERKQKKKYDSIRADFPEMVSKLLLLVNAGMTVNRAWEKVCSDSRLDTPLYLELRTTYLQIQGGMSEGEAYEAFARRCKIKEITKFVTLVIQNMKKGSGDMVPLLRLQAEECWELRKMRAKQLGEEASAKMIIPIMIMFIGILIIVVLPAVLQLSSL